MPRAPLAPFLHLVWLDTWSGFVIDSRLPHSPLKATSTKWWSRYLIMSHPSPNPIILCFSLLRTQNKLSGYHSRPHLTLKCHLALPLSPMSIFLVAPIAPEIVLD